MTVLGGFIHKSGLISIGSSSLIIDADVEYYQPTNTHSSNHPVSSGWYHSLYGKNNADASETISTVKLRAPVGGTCKGMGVDSTLNTSVAEHFVSFRVSGSQNVALTIPALTTGNVLNTDLDFPFEEGDFINLRNHGASGNLNFKITTNIVWN